MFFFVVFLVYLKKKTILRSKCGTPHLLQPSLWVIASYHSKLCFSFGVVLPFILSPSVVVVHIFHLMYV